MRDQDAATRVIIDGMTKLDERVGVPRIDRGARERLARATDVPGVVAASLIGSQARATAGPLSDVDVAVWLDPGLDGRRCSEISVQLTTATAAALGTDAIDLIVLNEASPLMRHRAMRDGIRLVERDRTLRVRLEARGLLDYLDTAPLRARLGVGVARRLDEGRFGRR